MDIVNENQLGRYIDKALQLCTLGQQEHDRTGKAILIVKKLYQYHENGYINDQLVITMNELDIETLEDIIRLYCDIRFFLDPQFNTITIFTLNDKTNEFITWFIKFFYYLEDIDLADTFPNHFLYSITDEIKEVFENKFVAFPVDVTNRKFMFTDLVVDII